MSHIHVISHNITQYIYMLVPSNMEWEDSVLYTNKILAIEQSLLYPNNRIEIFINKDGKYTPTYCYYKNGVLFEI